MYQLATQNNIMQKRIEEGTVSYFRTKKTVEKASDKLTFHELMNNLSFQLDQAK